MKMHDWKHVYELYSKMRWGLFAEQSDLHEVQDSELALSISERRLVEVYLTEPSRSPEDILKEFKAGLDVWREDEPRLAQIMRLAIDVFRDRHLADAMQIYAAVKT